MREAIEKAARLVAIRDCVLSFIIILATMVSWSADTACLLKLGGLMSLMLTLVLVARAGSVWKIGYARTDVWEMLGSERVNAVFAHKLIGGTLKRAYFTCALHAATASAVLLSMSVALDVVG